MLLAELGGAPAQLRVRGDPAAQGDGLPLAALQGAAELRDELLDDRALVAGGQVGAGLPGAVLAQLAHLVDERGLQPAE